MLTQPTISVVIPCFNGGRFLRETLASVLGQTRSAHEVIVIDDGSTDDSAAIAESFAPPVRVIRQRNQGESVARNRGIDEAKGDWVALLDADDLWDARKLERQVDCLKSSPDDCVCIYTDHFFYETDRIAAPPRPEFHRQPDARIRLLFDWCIIPSSAMIRRDVAASVRFVESIRLGEDMIFFAQMSERGPIVRVPEALTGYRRSPNQQIRSPGFQIKKMRCLHDWFIAQGERYPKNDQERFFERLRQEIIETHDVAFWERRAADVRECRQAFSDIFGAAAQRPETFQKRLLPPIIYAMKDWLDRSWALASPKFWRNKQHL